MDTYKINIEGLDRELRKFPVNDKLDIAAFIMFGDIEMTEVAARELLKRVPEHDVVVTAEAKGIPLCYEMARQGCRNYVVARKSVKVYMGNPIGVTVNSITTKNEQKLYLGEDDVNLLNGKRVLLVDDVISTGESLHALETLVEKQAQISLAGHQSLPKVTLRTEMTLYSSANSRFSLSNTE